MAAATDTAVPPARAHWNGDECRSSLHTPFAGHSQSTVERFRLRLDREHDLGALAAHRPRPHWRRRRNVRRPVRGIWSGRCGRRPIQLLLARSLWERAGSDCRDRRVRRRDVYGRRQLLACDQHDRAHDRGCLLGHRTVDLQRHGAGVIPPVGRGENGRDLSDGDLRRYVDWQLALG